MDRSAKGKLPYITLNGVDVSDSQFSVEYLTKHFGKDLSDGLTNEQKSIGRAFLKMMENSFFWYISFFLFLC